MILDTSVLFDAVVDGVRSGSARQFLITTEELSSPDLIRLEIAGALTRSVRRKDISNDYARAAYELAERSLPRVEDTASLMPRVFELSLELAHPCSDCVFLALAESRALPLATSDARFARKLADTRYARLIHLIEA
ncbi:type II toxin-antitoxin system VapC family toxin [Bosea sp. F3-2]|jgi:predicted nucleic acid-binding protein|uniref:type II toxin-antitoxin system VapC family toxin n=1 Tax=Bosea sp. F3-2 TaxID=2599640 RepID=UPI0011EE38D1|nr:type II toxin-antitoxin system VapC family toxin [Bosea sp. F3-2]QEL23436.1 type II toxin-antitoxin system VapC family toxin [Bosea sp. F3-2]